MKNPNDNFSKWLADQKAIISKQQKIKVDELVKVELLYAMNYTKNLN